MTAHDLLLQLRARGVEVKTSGDDRLVIDAPKGTVTEELRSALSIHKAEILQILKREQAGPAESAVSAAPAPAPVASVVTTPAAKAAPPAADVMSPVAVEPVSIAPPTRPSFRKDEEPAASAVEEINRLKAELMRLRTEEEGRRAEIE